MKKIIVIIFCLVTLLLSKDFEYSPAFKPGDKIIQGGLGFGMVGVYGDVVIPPLSLSIDIPKEIEGLPLSFGGIIGIAKSEYDYGWFTDDYTWTYTYFLIGGRGAFHHKFDSEKLDTYAGLMLGYNIVSFDEPSGWSSAYGYDGGDSYLTYGFYVGGRYFFNEKFAAYGELGYGFGYINVGISYKL